MIESSEFLCTCDVAICLFRDRERTGGGGVGEKERDILKFYNIIILQGVSSLRSLSPCSYMCGGI